MPDRIDFRALKASISLETVLSGLGWRPGSPESPTRLVGACPVHGGDNPSAFVVHRRENRWHCFTACQRGGDVLDLAAALWRCSLKEAAQRLADRAPLTGTALADSKTETTVFRPFTLRIPLNPEAPFLAQKGILATTAGTFEVGGYHGLGWLRGCVGVRLFSPEGAPLGYAGRCLAPARGQSKWKFPAGLPASELLYNYHRVVANGASEFLITECPWGVLRLHQVGIPAVALMGLSLSEPQRQLLERFRRVVLLLDGDDAGRHAALSIAKRLESGPEVQIQPLPEGMDPDDLTDVDLAAIGRALLEPRFNPVAEASLHLRRDSTPTGPQLPSPEGVEKRSVYPFQPRTPIGLQNPTRATPGTTKCDPLGSQKPAVTH